MRAKETIDSKKASVSFDAAGSMSFLKEFTFSVLLIYDPLVFKLLVIKIKLELYSIYSCFALVCAPLLSVCCVICHI